MYKWDHVHTKALKTKSDSIYNPCRSLKNHVTKVMQENKLNCHKAINSLCPSDPRKMWPEIKESKNQTETLQMTLMIFLCWDPKNIRVFKFKHIFHTEIESYFNSLTNKGGNYTLNMDIKFIHKCVKPVLNSLRPRQNGRRFADDTFKAFSWMKMLEFRLIFHWSLFLRVQLTIFHHWFR